MCGEDQQLLIHRNHVGIAGGCGDSRTGILNRVLVGVSEKKGKGEGVWRSRREGERERKRIGTLVFVPS
jgi:hypothetical protein